MDLSLCSDWLLQRHKSFGKSHVFGFNLRFFVHTTFIRSHPLILHCTFGCHRSPDLQLELYLDTVLLSMAALSEF
jgi:hypothetical protein